MQLRTIKKQFRRASDDKEVVRKREVESEQPLSPIYKTVAHGKVQRQAGVLNRGS